MTSQSFKLAIASRIRTPPGLSVASTAACLRGRPYPHVHGHAAVGGRVDQGAGGEKCGDGEAMRKWGVTRGRRPEISMKPGWQGCKTCSKTKRFFYQNNGQVCNYDVISWISHQFLWCENHCFDSVFAGRRSMRPAMAFSGLGWKTLGFRTHVFIGVVIWLICSMYRKFTCIIDLWHSCLGKYLHHRFWIVGDWGDVFFQ